MCYNAAAQTKSDTAAYTKQYHNRSDTLYINMIMNVNKNMNIN